MRIALLVLGIAGCGRIGFSSDGTDANPRIDGRPLDDAGLGDPNGFWVWTSGKLTQETQTRSRADLQNGVRADLAIDGLRIGGRIVPLGAGVPLGLGATSGVLGIDGARWTVLIDGAISVFDATWMDADHVALRRDPTAPETTGLQQIDVANLERSTPPPIELVGTKLLLRIEHSDTGDVAANECAAYNGSDSQRISGTLTISPSFVVTIEFQYRYYTGSSCAGAEQLVTHDGMAVLEAEAGMYRMFIDVDSYAPTTTSGALTIDQTTIRFDSTACVPAGADCDVSPSMMLLAR